MITFKLFLIVFFSLISLILIFRLFSKKGFYFTSRYCQEKEFTMNEILKKNIIKALKKANFKNVKENKTHLSAFALPSIFSFSERILVDIEEINETKCIVKFNSTCFFPLQVFDWGKNERNANLFFKNFEASF